MTGVAGFIGSHVLTALLELGQRVVGLDNFATGSRANLDDVRSTVGPEAWCRFHFIEGDICDLECCREAMSWRDPSRPRGGSPYTVDRVLHQAALGSVPRSIESPIDTNATNINGFVNVLVAARDAGAGRIVYASSSSAYGDSETLPKVEDEVGRPLSPYAVTKQANELYAGVFSRTYGTDVVGLRYFNVFGPRQDPQGAYAAVVPKWIDGLVRGEPVYINGDGETSRDFCYVANVVQANMLAATTNDPDALNQVYNIAVGEQTSLNELYRLMRGKLEQQLPHVSSARPVFRDFRKGDVRHSVADVGKASRLLGYRPLHDIDRGLSLTIDWHLERLAVPLETQSTVALTSRRDSGEA